MQQTPFHAYLAARTLEQYSENELLLPALASANIEIYPYQIAAARFALRSPYLRGCILCDEGSLGKTFEAMLVATQKWYEGQNRQLVILPANLVKQWITKIENSFNLPYVLIDNEGVFGEMLRCGEENPFIQDAVVITTYDFAVEKAAYIQKQLWDLIIFDEADRLNKAHTGDNKTACVLKEATSGSYKILLTPTPITKDIMDIYGLIYFIDEGVLPDAEDFYARYFRKPENYPDLTKWVSKYCFRTLKSQVTDYVTFSSRVPYVVNYELTAEERPLYALLAKYLDLPKKYAYPKIDPYRLAVSILYPALSSSAQAFVNTIDVALNRLENNAEITMQNAEIEMLKQIKRLAEKVEINGKAIELLSILKKTLPYLRKLKLPQKAVVFTTYRITQEHLYRLLSDASYQVLQYSGANSRDYEIIEQFRNDKTVQILIATDEAAKGLDIEFCPLVINYDLLYNSIQMEQRISRCHRQGQKSDVLVVNLIGQSNMADVRALELINKRVLQFDGIFGMSDAIIGNFDKNINEVLENVRPPDEVAVAFQSALSEHEQANRHLVAHTEDTLFTTFSKEIADKVTVTPQYISGQIGEINRNLWNVVKWFFEKYNQDHTDCTFEINEQEQTVTTRNGEALPHLFYYWNGSQNKPYKSLKSYGMNKEFKPRHGRITLSSIIGRGILHEVECVGSGTMIVNANIESCSIGLYCVEIRSKTICPAKEYSVLIGKTVSGEVLSHEKCEKIMELPVTEYMEDGRKSPHWLKNTGGSPHELDRLVPIEKLIQQYAESKNSAQTEEIERMKLQMAKEKAALDHALDDIKAQIAAAQQEADAITLRIKRIALEKKLTVLQQELKQKGNQHFLDGIGCDTRLEKQIGDFIENEKPTAKVVRQFVIKVKGCL